MNFNNITPLQKSEVSKDDSIKVIRVVAMLMIVGCHISSYVGCTVLGLALDVGVQIFLFISGWLYSEKKIDNNISWLVRKWVNLCIPAYIWAFVMYLVSHTWGRQKKGDVWLYFLTHFFNLQGWNKVFTGYPLKWVKCISGCGHMWFLTALMLCYFLMLIWKKMYDQRSISGMQERRFRWWYCMLGAVCVCAGGYIGICFEWFYIYFLGYFLRRSWKEVTQRQYLFLSTLMVAAMVVRLVGREYLDDTVYYDGMIVFLTHNILAIWIVATIRFCDERTQIVKQLADLKSINWFDAYSYEIYIVHFGILEICSMLNMQNTILEMIIFLWMSMACAILLKKSSNIIVNAVRRLYSVEHHN